MLLIVAMASLGAAATAMNSTPVVPAKKADPVKKAATLVRKAAMPQQLIVSTPVVPAKKADPVKKAATLVRKAAMPQQLIVQVGLKMPCDSKHPAVAQSRIMLAAAGINATYASRCASTTGKSGSQPSQVAEVVVTFYDRAVRSAFYTTLHKLVYTRDKSAGAAAFFPGLSVTTVVLRKNPADPPSFLSRASTKIILSVAFMIAVLAVIVAIMHHNRANLPPEIAKYFPVKETSFPPMSATESGKEEAA